MARMVTPAAEIAVTVPARPERVDDPDMAQIRAWAIRYQFISAGTGRLPARIVAMYRRLHPGGVS